MKLHRNTTMALVATLLLTLTFSSCTYEDGPSISLRSKKARLTGEWEGKTIAGESVEDGLTLDLEFKDDGKVDLTLGFLGSTTTETQEWEWKDGKEKLEITDADGDKQEWTITRLTNSELEFTDEDNEEFKFEKK